MINILNLVVDIPTLVLIALLVMGAIVMYLAQRQSDFNFADMLKDDNGKPSAMRLAVFVCLALSSWGLIKLTMTYQDLDKIFNYYVVYISIWSGAKIVEKTIDLLITKFGK